MITGLVQSLLGAYLSWIFTSLIIGAIRDPASQSDLFKTSRVSPPTPGFKLLLWCLLIALWLLFVMMLLSGIDHIWRSIQ